jgi:hypothetical protein
MQFIAVRDSRQMREYYKTEEMEHRTGRVLMVQDASATLLMPMQVYDQRFCNLFSQLYWFCTDKLLMTR